MCVQVLVCASVVRACVRALACVWVSKESMNARFCVYRPLPGGARHKLQVGSSLPPLQLLVPCLSVARSCSSFITLPRDLGKWNKSPYSPQRWRAWTFGSSTDCRCFFSWNALPLTWTTKVSCGRMGNLEVFSDSPWPCTGNFVHQIKECKTL